MSENTYILLAIAVCSAVTLFTRACPFLIFKKRTPAFVLYLGKVLPYPVMAMLVVFCFKNTDFTGGGHYGLLELIASAVVIGLHKWKHNTLLSILVGTIIYMLLVQRVFV